MFINYKRLDSKAVAPKQLKNGDAGFDLTAIEFLWIGDLLIYRTGIAFEIPENHVGLLFPRSSISKTGLRLSNSVGVIDSGYRGEVCFVFDKMPVASEESLPLYELGERIGQIVFVPIPKVHLLEVSDLSETERGEDGFGSTGK